MSPSKPTWNPIVTFGLLFLVPIVVYTWAVPFRDIFGLEARNALMAREMIENGLTLIPRAMGRPYPDYPPLYFWFAYLFSVPVMKVTPLTIVLPSAISAASTKHSRYLLPLYPALALLLAGAVHRVIESSERTRFKQG